MENFRVTPSLPALSSIAGALGVTLAELFEGIDRRPPIVVTRKTQREVIQRDEEIASRLTYESLASGRPARKMDPFVLTVPPTDQRPPLSHPGEEFLLVLSGAARLEYADQRFEMEAGDSAYFDGENAHRLVCTGETPAQVLVVYFGANSESEGSRLENGGRGAGEARPPEAEDD